MKEKLIWDISGYELSHNYKTLFSLLQTQSIVCLFDEAGREYIGKTLFRKINMVNNSTKKSKFFYDIQLYTRETHHISLCEPIETAEAIFCKKCAQRNLNFIVPTLTEELKGKL